MGVVRALASALRRPLLLCILAIFPTLALAQNGAFMLGVGSFTNETDGSDVGTISTGDALAEFLHTDLLEQMDDGQDYSWCPAQLIEVRRKQVIIDEQNFQQTKYVDRATAIKPEDMGVPDPTVLIEGEVSVVLGQVSWTIHVRETSGGPDLATYEGRDPVGELSEVSRKIARTILENECPIPYNVTGGGARIVITGLIFKLNQPFVLEGAFPGGKAILTYFPTSQQGGTVEYTMSGGGFSGAGSGTYTLSDGADGIKQIAQKTLGCVNGIPNSCKDNSETLTLTPVGN